MQLLTITGVSPPKAAVITTKFPTIARLMEGFNSSNDAKTLLQDLEWQPGKRIGPALSKKVWEYYCGSG